MSATILYRALDPTTHDPIWGNGLANFLTDIYAVAQAIDTSLQLFVGEWWASLSSGLSMFPTSFGSPSILGSANSQATAASTLIQQAILGVPYVTGLTAVETAIDYNSRQFVFACVATTAFGSIAVATAPGLGASLVVPNSTTSLLSGN